MSRALQVPFQLTQAQARCAGEYIARETARLVLQRFEVEIISSDLRKVGLITQRLKRVTCYLRKRAAVSTCARDSAEVQP